MERKPQQHWCLCTGRLSLESWLPAEQPGRTGLPLACSLLWPLLQRMLLAAQVSDTAFAQLHRAFAVLLTV